MVEDVFSIIEEAWRDDTQRVTIKMSWSSFDKNRKLTERWTSEDKQSCLE